MCGIEIIQLEMVIFVSADIFAACTYSSAWASKTSSCVYATECRKTMFHILGSTRNDQGKQNTTVTRRDTQAQTWLRAAGIQLSKARGLDH